MLKAPPEEESRDACCSRCGSMFHSTENHPVEAGVRGLMGPATPDFPLGYDPGEADRLIGRDPGATQ